ncbi:MAG: immunoglobulin E-set [Olpidium bornovanus]|uniref:Immunoglobulin E-set n=1 Tax=Olpidium bornovanus TaxID=278681 RepID=A0A8H8A1E9_9FUNG|nr:MAG: immunoglobulin E-set [Olpidium bornovanus]
MSQPNLASGAFQSSDDLETADAAGYRPGQKKTVDELKDLDKNDESLNKWKESLGLGKAVGPADDPRRVVVLWLALEVEGRPDVKVDLSTPEAVEKAKSQTITIKEGVEYRESSQPSV